MARDICIYLDFLQEKHKEEIRSCAASCGFTPHFFPLAQFEEARDCLQNCEILYAHSPALLKEAPASLQWYACAFAGVDPYCKEEGLFANPHCLLTNSNVYGLTISEHVLMVLLMLLRKMPRYEAMMEERQWENQLPIRSICGGRFTLLGTGDIGRSIAQRLHALGAARVLGLSRSGRPAPGFDEIRPIGELDALLPETEVLILALPGTAETAHILDGRRMALLPRGALIINVGRGSAIEQTALVDALNRGHLGGAALDVMEQEPLPREDPLWTARNVILTPHISGNMTLGYTCDKNVALFCDNLRRYAAGERLQGLVDRRLGY